MAQSQDRTIDNISIALLCFGEPVPLFFCWHDCEPNFRTMMVEITKLRVRLNSHGESELSVEDGFAAVVMNLNSTYRCSKKKRQSIGLARINGKVTEIIDSKFHEKTRGDVFVFLLERVSSELYCSVSRSDS